MSLALARIGQDRRLSLFYIELRPHSDKKLNGIEIVRLKNKLGTKGLPTAELRLNGCLGYLIGDRERGTKYFVLPMQFLWLSGITN
jgi:alkylation response protein AidB-like acyl-CoA dehydrogenase